MKRFVWLPVFLAALLIAPAALAATWVPGAVPDWNQPYSYAPPGNDPNPGVNTDPYDNWCCPTAAANLFGWWEDNPGFAGVNLTGLTDRQVFGASPLYANNNAAPLWQQGLWHDGTVEIGWFMDTNQWASNPGANGWPNAGGGTLLGAISPGAASYAAGAWADATSGLVKVGYNCNFRIVAAGGGITPAQAWADYVADIKAGMPLLVTFDRWINPDSEQPVAGEPGVFEYDFGIGGMAHTVTGVGFIDPNPAVMDGGEMFIVHDSWSNTQTNVAVNLWTVWTGNPETSTPAPWLQNDHLWFVPEPGVMLLVAGGLLLLIRRRRR
jgi:hypothetical protein